MVQESHGAIAGRELGAHSVCFCALLAVLLPAAIGCQDRIHDVVNRRDFACATGMLDADPGLVSAVNSLGKTPLHYAVTYGVSDFIDLLAARGADINAADQTGLTPLHVAAMLGRTSEAERLLRRGAALEPRDSFGDTPLHIAAVFGQRPMAELLVKAGACPSATNRAGRTCLDSAKDYRRDDTAAFLVRVVERGL